MEREIGNHLEKSGTKIAEMGKCQIILLFLEDEDIFYTNLSLIGF
ncbi:MAG: hypothetical protein ABIK99_02165 [candidate division WOR-3 bacterium]